MLKLLLAANASPLRSDPIFAHGCIGQEVRAGSGGWSSTLELSKLKAVLNLMRKDMLLSQALAMESYDAVSSLGGPRRGLAQCTRTPRFNLHSRHTSARLLALCAD